VRYHLCWQNDRYIGSEVERETVDGVYEGFECPHCGKLVHTVEPTFDLVLEGCDVRVLR